MTADKNVLIPHDKMMSVFLRILKKHGFSGKKAIACATVFAENTVDGVNSHGVNRFSRFIAYVKAGHVRADQNAKPLHQSGVVEQWDGNLGPGITNALRCTDRAMEIARTYGMGCVALANTNHWMRGGTYGWRAAKSGYVFIGWTNTLANMPPWGALNNKLGNNPIVLAVPYLKEAIVLDMAMSQFSYGVLEDSAARQQLLPVPGGFDEEGNLSQDASAILRRGRVLPAGYWKGAGLSLLLDIMATILSGGLSTAKISLKEAESGVSQVFIAIDLNKLPHYNTIHGLIENIINDYKTATPEKATDQIVYPGERVVKIREKNLKEGIPVNNKVWNEILALEKA